MCLFVFRLVKRKRSHCDVVVTIHRKRENEFLSFVLRVSVNFNSFDNYRSGVYIGFTCARNEFDNVFVTMFGCPMQSGLKSKQWIKQLVCAPQTDWMARLFFFSVMSWCEFVVQISNQRRSDFPKMKRKKKSNSWTRFSLIMHSLVEFWIYFVVRTTQSVSLGLPWKLLGELPTSLVWRHAHQRLKSRFDAAIYFGPVNQQIWWNMCLWQASMAYAPLWDSTHVICSVWTSIGYFGFPISRAIRLSTPWK